MHLAKHMLIYEAVTGHWIDDDWNLHEALLEFQHIEGHHDGEHLARELFQILEYYDISTKLFCITSDSAGNCGTLCKELSKILRDEKGIRWNHEERYIRCMNHVINLAVQDFLKSIKGTAPEQGDENATDYEDGANEDDIQPSGFASAMWKLRKLTKVLLSTL